MPASHVRLLGEGKAGLGKTGSKAVVATGLSEAAPSP